MTNTNDLDENYEIKTFGELVEGDYIKGANGEDVLVSAAYEKHIPETMYEIELENGTIIKASGNHLWYVESEYNLANHFNRVQESRKFLKKTLDKETIDKLYSIAIREENNVETSLKDMAAINKSNEEEQTNKIMIRIARSLGPISDNTETIKDFETDEIIGNMNVPYYDAKLFCQQILALYHRKYSKRWPVIKGEVVTTEELLNFYETVEIPTLKNLENV